MAQELEDQLLLELIRENAQSIKTALVFALSENEGTLEDPGIIFQLYSLIDQLN
jgi:hypothetical protein